MSTDTSSGEPTEVSQVVEHLFRHESAKMVATLTRIFGVEHLGLAEDVVQEVLGRVLQTWPYYGVPKNPAAWIMRAARNLALDVVRREKVFRDKQAEIVQLMDRPALSPDDKVFDAQEITDDRLRMMFVCCHPLISQEDQVALTLKTLCGFGLAEIAQAFLTSEAAIAKRLTRAKQKIREARIAFEIPEGDELTGRQDAVLQSLYLLFNEGYKASSGDSLVREDLCHEAIRLTTLLAEHPVGNNPRTHALLALMLLNAARLSARVDGEGNLLRLQEQNRSQWNQAMIARGMFHVAQSAAGGEASEFHLQAGIAACHCTARDYTSTDWTQILGLYDQLVRIDTSPVISLNRAVAVAEVHGPQAGINAVEAIANVRSLKSYYLLHAVLGEFEARLNHFPSAVLRFRRALELAVTKSEKTFLTRRWQECEISKNNSVPAGTGKSRYL